MNNRRFWVGVLVSCFFLLLFLREVDINKVIRAIQETNHLYLIPAVIVYFVSVYCRAIRWRFLILPMKSLDVRSLYPAVVVGYMANNLLPVRLGEFVRAYYLARLHKISASGLLATILVERVFDGLTLLALFGVVSAAVPTLGVIQSLAQQLGLSPMFLGLVFPLLFIGVASFLVLVAVLPGRVLNIGWRIVGRLPPNLISRVQPISLRFLEGLLTLKTSRGVLILFVLSIPVWLAESAMYLILGYAFHIHEFFDTAGSLVAAILLLTAVANLGTSIPSSPGGVGPFEFFGKSILVFMGVESIQATAYVGVLHLALLLPVTLLGLVYLRAGHLTLRALTKGVAPEIPAEENESTELRKDA